MLQHNTTIQNVDMRFCDLDDMAIPPLVSALKSRDKQLQTLQILGNHFRFEFAPWLGPSDLLTPVSYYS
jgi:hypothetical protein